MPALAERTRRGPATDRLSGLGRLEQLVLRGDGLTTTSLQVLTGEVITSRPLQHWVVAATDDLATLGAEPSAYTGTASSAVATELRRAHDLLELLPDESLLIREVLLGGPSRVWATATVALVLDRLPIDVVRTLSTSEAPIGPTLHAGGVVTGRRLTGWGRRVAGRWAAHLAGVRSKTELVPGREYLMTLPLDGRPLGYFVEWFAPALFDPALFEAAPGARADGRKR